ncbi:MAG: Holliday junction DNA helicase RuvA [Gammaproteobacteria bacterium RIFCSPHIGHO2_12_FULL_40_19]|nr:MAG: Holliday junction DNA helicase RuvA [Gammaproteobacteria bacterium RIFCSPHIGHO2_12_FULL_40_19]
MHQTVLGFDFGLRRIGVAVGQAITQSARPLTILNAKQGVPHWLEIKKLILEWGADALIVGLPLNMDGTEQPMTVRARAFGQQLQTHFQRPVFFVDERLTTIAAKDEMHTHLKGAARFDRVDSVSAKLIVESWFGTL